MAPGLGTNGIYPKDCENEVSSVCLNYYSRKKINHYEKKTLLDNPRVVNPGLN